MLMVADLSFAKRTLRQSSVPQEQDKKNFPPMEWALPWALSDQQGVVPVGGSIKPCYSSSAGDIHESSYGD